MSVSKYYNKVFKAPLTALGFKKQGKLFYRIKGNTIQAVLLDDIKPFRIFYTVYPYWCHRLIGIKCNKAVQKLKKGWWAQNSTYTQGMYYYADCDENFTPVMELCLKAFTDNILPYFDSLTNEETCLIESIKPIRTVSADEPTIYNEDEFCANTKINMGSNQYLLLWKAYLDGSFDEASKLMDQDVQNYRNSARETYYRNNKPNPQYMESIKKHIEILAATCPEMSYQEAYDEAYRIWGPKDIDIDAMLDEQCQKFIKAQYRIFLERRNENDLAWIKTIRDEETAVMQKALIEELGLEI